MDIGKGIRVRDYGVEGGTEKEKKEEGEGRGVRNCLFRKRTVWNTGHESLH